MQTLSLPLMMILASLILANLAHARPQFVLMDVADRDSRPATHGYYATAKSAGERTKFLVVLDRDASKALRDSKVFFHTPVDQEPEIALATIFVDGIKRIEFEIPTKLLKSCALHLDSAWDGRGGDSPPNFGGYRLRLDNLEGKNPVSIKTQKVGGGGVQFTISYTRPARHAGPTPPIRAFPGKRWFEVDGPGFSMRLPQASPSRDDRRLLEQQFTLPASLAAKLFLVVHRNLHVSELDEETGKHEFTSKRMPPTRIPLGELIPEK